MQLFCDISDYPVAFLLPYYVPDRQGCQRSQVLLYYLLSITQIFWCIILFGGAAYLPHGLRSSYLTLFLVSIVNIQQSNAGVSRRVVKGDTPPLLTRVPTLVSQDLCRASSLRAPGADSRKSIRWLLFRRMSCTSITPPLG